MSPVDDDGFSSTSVDSATEPISSANATSSSGVNRRSCRFRPGILPGDLPLVRDDTFRMSLPRRACGLRAGTRDVASSPTAPPPSPEPPSSSPSRGLAPDSARWCRGLRPPFLSWPSSRSRSRSLSRSLSRSRSRCRRSRLLPSRRRSRSSPDRRDRPLSPPVGVELPSSRRFSSDSRRAMTTDGEGGATTPSRDATSSTPLTVNPATSLNAASRARGSSTALM
mmetsp:Transcript_27558/g.95294  ORF Transcript_27558/g.95294 Transcript_27558/m.95294 type:complete len:224 (+) Transcript_27558:2468-3139(+)